MALSALAVAKLLGCAHITVTKAIKRGELIAQRENGRWLIDESSIVKLRERLNKLASVRQQRAEKLRSLWQSGRLQPRKRKRQQPVQVLRPKILAANNTQSPIFFVGENEATTFCPQCRAHLRILIG